jgi:hypothetical protein
MGADADTGARFTEDAGFGWEREGTKVDTPANADSGFGCAEDAGVRLGMAAHANAGA